MSVNPISTHALTWSATGFCAYPRVANPFQLTHSRGVRPAAIGSSSGGREFQLTHSRGVRRQADRYDSRCQHFNSRTHVECDVMMLGEITEDGISTHALTWSATVCAKSKDLPRIISTHALTWSATCVKSKNTRLRLFQLTHSRGVRPSPSSSSYAFSPFQLTHSRGVRPCFHMLLHQQMNFNSRTHVECDAFPFRTTFSLSNFNSRTHVECDYDCIDCHVEYYNISTHALTWSATIAQSLAQRPAVFQLTHSRGVRPAGCTDNGK